MKKKHIAQIGLIISAFIALPFIATFWAEYTVKNVEAISKQTGISLPAGTNILNAKAELFSLADGTNYHWLISGTSSLIPWVSSIGQREGPGTGGWSNIHSFQDVSPFKVSRFEQQTLHSVWQIVKDFPDKQETCYLFIANDKTTGVLSTFRP